MDEIRELVGRDATVFFISHDLEQVAAVCDRVMWLEQGEVREVGRPEGILEHYARHAAEHAA
jgi:ABC-type polysaccharide/polyol phosphate transport system ATPase subunit